MSCSFCLLWNCVEWHVFREMWYFEHNLGTSAQAATNRTFADSFFTALLCRLFSFCRVWIYLLFSNFLPSRDRANCTRTKGDRQNCNRVCLKLETRNMGDIPHERTKYSSNLMCPQFLREWYFVSVLSKHLNFATFSKDLSAVLLLWTCLARCLQNVNVKLAWPSKSPQR